MPRTRGQVSALGKRKRSDGQMTRSVKSRRSVRKGTKKGLGRVTALSPNDFGFPDRLQTKLVYGDVVTLDITAGAVDYHTFRLNSLFDPDYTGVGHQPQWFDQLSAVYRNYRVKGAKITANFMTNFTDTTSGTYGPWLVGITTQNQTTLSAATVASLTEDANGVNGVLGAKQGSNNIKTLSNTFSPSRDLGLDAMDSDLSALTSTNPAQQLYAHCWAIEMGSVNSSVIKVRVKIEFTCEFFNRIEGVLS